eukprot:5958091-Pyramimonas_sp.AAC.1
MAEGGASGGDRLGGRGGDIELGSAIHRPSIGDGLPTTSPHSPGQGGSSGPARRSMCDWGSMQPPLSQSP